MTFEDFKYVEYGIEMPNKPARYTLDNGGRCIWEWKNHFTTIEEIPTLVNYANNKGHSFHRSLQQYCDVERSEYKISLLLMDFDHESNPQIALNQAYSCLNEFKNDFDLPSEIIEVYYSGSKGAGAVLNPENFLKGVIPSPHEVYKKLLEPYSKKYNCLDLGVYGKARLWRPANALHVKHNRYRPQITIDEVKDLKRLIILAQKPRLIYEPHIDFFSSKLAHTVKQAQKEVIKEKKSHIKIEKKFEGTVNDNLYDNANDVLDNLPRKFADIANGRSEGGDGRTGRNDGLCTLVGFMRFIKDYPSGLILDTALEYNRRCSPPKKSDVILKQTKQLL